MPNILPELLLQVLSNGPPSPPPQVLLGEHAHSHGVPLVDEESNGNTKVRTPDDTW